MKRILSIILFLLSFSLAYGQIPSGTLQDGDSVGYITPPECQFVVLAFQQVDTNKTWMDSVSLYMSIASSPWIPVDFSVRDSSRVVWNFYNAQTRIGYVKIPKPANLMLVLNNIKYLTNREVKWWAIYQF